jgi:hypothetical protein
MIRPKLLLKLVRATIAVSSILTIVSCASIVSAPPGAYKFGGEEVVQLGREWSDITAIVPQKGPGVRILTVDGPLLNQLHLAGGLKPGQAMVRTFDRERPTPTLRADMTGTERIEFVRDTVTALGVLQAETSSPRPWSFRGSSAIRVDLDGRMQSGLAVKGAGVIAPRGDTHTVIIYLAPAEHYFSALAPEVDRVLSSP